MSRRPALPSKSAFFAGLPIRNANRSFTRWIQPRRRLLLEGPEVAGAAALREAEGEEDAVAEPAERRSIRTIRRMPTSMRRRLEAGLPAVEEAVAVAMQPNLPIRSRY